MADIHDYMHAADRTDDADRELRSLERELQANAAAGSWSAAMIARAICIGSRGIMAAIREASTRFDYVARDLERR